MAGTRTRLTMDQTMHALALLARGDTLSQTAAALLDLYQLSVSESALSQMRKRHMSTIETMRDKLADAEAVEVDSIQRKARRMLSKKLDKADRDANALEEVDQQYRDGEIKDVDDYRRRKAGLLKLSISELNQISKNMFSQTQKVVPPGETPPLIPAHGVATPAALEGLMDAIKNNNTVELQRIIFSR